MVGISARCIANTKIVNNQAEDDVFGVMTPQTRSERNWAISMGG